MTTSCCPAWHSMVYKLFPTETKKVSMTLTPMVFTARLMKKQNPGCKVVFVGPLRREKAGGHPGGTSAPMWTSC